MSFGIDWIVESWKSVTLRPMFTTCIFQVVSTCFQLYNKNQGYTVQHMWPWITKPDLSRMGTFFVKEKNTLYGSK